MQQPLPFEPRYRRKPDRTLDVPSSWRDGQDELLADVLDRFCPHRRLALEFGVEYGYTAALLANSFEGVHAVDHFRGDEHAGPTPEDENREANTTARLSAFPGVRVFAMDWREYAANMYRPYYGLVHVDMYHDYDTTYWAGLWAVNHASAVLFHDTHHPAFDGVTPAVRDLSEKYGLDWYDSAEGVGFSVLVRPR